MSSAWDNLVGGLKYAGSEFSNLFNPNWWQGGSAGGGVQIDYTFFMTLTLKMWQAAHDQLIQILETLLSERKLTIAQYNAIINRRNKLYSDAKIKAPTLTYKAPPPPPTTPTVKQNVTDMIDNFKSVGNELVGGVTSGTGSAAGAVVNSALNMPIAYVFMAVMVLFVLSTLKKVF